MRCAVFSDIHGNMQASRAVLGDMELQGAQVMVCLGDIVGYGPAPQEVLQEIRQRTDNIVDGNHDAAAVGVINARQFNDHARKVIEWTRKQLSPDSLKFLRSLPLVLETDTLLFVHAGTVVCQQSRPGK